MVDNIFLAGACQSSDVLLSCETKVDDRYENRGRKDDDGKVGDGDSTEWRLLTVVGGT